MMIRVRARFRSPRLFLPPRAQLVKLAQLVASNLLKLGLGVFTSGLVFRALAPADAGRLALTLSIVGLFSIIGEFGLRDAAVTFIARYLPLAPERAHAVSRTFLVVKVGLASLAALGTFSAGAVIAGYIYPDAQITNLLRLGAFSLISGGLLGYAQTVLEARRSFSAISALGVLQALVRTLLIFMLFVAGEVNLAALLLVEIAVPLVAFLYALRLLPAPFYRLQSPYLDQLPDLFHFAKWIAVAALASTIFLKLDVLVLSALRPTAEVGLYAVALALVSRLDVFKGAVLTMAFPEAARRTRPTALRQFVSQSLRLTLPASIALAPLAIFSGVIIWFIYGESYVLAAAAFVPLLFAFLVGLNVEPLSYVLYALNKPRWIAAMDIALLVLSFSLNLALIPPLGIQGTAYSVLAARLTGAAVTLFLVRRALEQAE